MRETEYVVFQTDGCTPESTSDAERREVARFEAFAEARNWARLNQPRHGRELVPQRGRFLQIRDRAGGLIWESWRYRVLCTDTFSREHYGSRAFVELHNAKRHAVSTASQTHNASEGLRDTVTLTNKLGDQLWTGTLAAPADAAPD